MTIHGALTVIAKIKPEMTDQLRQKLQEIVDRDVEDNPIMPFKSLTAVHFARWVILEEAKDLSGRVLPARLVFATDYDAPLEEHLDELVSKVGSGLATIFSHCEGFPVKDGLAAPQIRDFIRSHMVDYNTFYIGTRGRSCPQIHMEDQLRKGIVDFLDREVQRPGWANQDEVSIRKRILDFVKGPKLKWALRPPGPPGLGFKLKYWGTLVVTLLCLLVLLPLLILAAPVWVVMLRVREKKDDEKNEKADIQHVGDLLDTEDHIVQNQMTLVSDIKPGLFRLITQKLILWGVDFLARYKFNKGQLGGIPTIHFARWIIIDEGKRLLFFSNFDASWENYLGDFIDKAAGGLTAVWSNTAGFPKTRFLVMDGARDEQKFKEFVRGNQIRTQVWYSGYKDLTVNNINNNSKLRLGLSSRMSRRARKEWLRRFGYGQ